jgi:hypothetical protein
MANHDGPSGHRGPAVRREWTCWGDTVNMPEWLERAAPGQLAIFLSQQPSARKSGLFIRHLCRCFPEIFYDPRSRDALDAADRYEAGELDRDDYLAALRAAHEAAAQAQANYAAWVADPTLEFGANRPSGTFAAGVASAVASRGHYPTALSDLRRAVLNHAGAGGGPRKNPTARVMRPVFLEHFGDPHQPVAFSPEWRTDTAVSLARSMYASRDFSAMPILADALQDAGCDSDDTLDHCRGEGPHVRGCWVADLILGKG